MRRYLVVFGVAAIASATLPGAEAIRSLATSSGSQIAMTIDGAFAGAVRSWDGGEARGTVVTIAMTGSVPSKHISGVTYDSLVVQCPLPPSAKLLEVISDFIANRVVARTILLTEWNVLGAVVRSTQLRATLSEIHFPAFDARTSEPLSVKLVFAVAETTTPTGASNNAGATTTSLASNSFSLALAGIDTRRVIRIEPFSIIQRSTPDSEGKFRVPTSTRLPPEFTNLLVTIADSSVASWHAWFDDFVMRGNNGQDREKSAALSFVGSTFGLNFEQVGIVRVTRLPATAGAIGMHQSELYFERMSVGPPPIASDSLAATGVNLVREPVREVAGTIASPAETSTMIATAPRAAEAGLPVREIQPSTGIPVTAAINSGEIGTRDPAGFPRVSGLTRTYYSGSFFDTYTSEQAYYTSTEAIYDLVNRVSAAARADGWTLRSHSEDNSANGRSVAMGWVKAKADVGLNFVEQHGGGIRLQVTVSVQLQ